MTQEELAELLRNQSPLEGYDSVRSTPEMFLPIPMGSTATFNEAHKIDVPEMNGPARSASWATSPDLSSHPLKSEAGAERMTPSLPSFAPSPAAIPKRSISNSSFTKRPAEGLTSQSPASEPSTVSPSVQGIDPSIRDFVAARSAREQELADASDLARQRRMGVGLAQSLSQFIQGSTGAKSNENLYASLMRDADAPISDVQTKYKMEDEAITREAKAEELQRMREMKDPRSELNRKFQKTVEPYAKLIGINPGEITLEQYQLYKPVYEAMYQAKMKKDDQTLEILKKGMELEKEKRKESKEMDKEDRERRVKDVGVFPTKEDRQEFLKTAVDVQKGVAGIDELIALSKKPFKSISLEDRARANTLVTTLQGALRQPLVGPGAVSDSERQMLKDAIRNPTAVFSYDPSNRVALETLKKIMNRSLKIEAQLRGAEIDGAEKDAPEDGWNDQKKKRLKELRAKKARGEI